MLFIATYSFLREIILDNEFISSFKIHKDTDSVEKKKLSASYSFNNSFIWEASGNLQQFPWKKPNVT